MKNFDAAVEIIGQALFEYIYEGLDDPENTESRALTEKFMECAKNGYVVVEQEEIVEHMEEEWFKKEAILFPALATEDSKPKWFIPIARFV